MTAGHARTAASRILLIGAGGAGKSTLARQLAGDLGLPLVHLDRLYWHAGWIPTADDEWDRIIEREIAGDRWVMDGNYGRTLPRRLGRATMVIWLDLSRWLCLWRVIRRQLRYAGRSRPELPAGCPERPSLEFLTWIWTYPERRGPGIRRQLDALPDDIEVVVLRSRAEVRRFREAIAGRMTDA